MLVAIPLVRMASGEWRRAFDFQLHPCKPPGTCGHGQPTGGVSQNRRTDGAPLLCVQTIIFRQREGKITLRSARG